MKKYLLSLFFLSLTVQNFAQQVGLSSQYLFNDFLYNPAVAGVKDYLPISLSLRRQWMGIDEAPVTQSVAAHGYIGMNLGCGGYLINEVTGPTKRTAANLSVAYHLKLKQGQSRNKETHVLSFGLAAMISQHKYDLNKLHTYEPDDAALMNTLNYQLIPDANFGLYYHFGNNYFAGLSVFHLVQTRRDLFEVVTPFDNGFKRQYNLTGGYNFVINNQFSLQPAFMAYMIEALPFQIDGNLKFIYDKKYWFSAGYRLKDAVTFALGIQKDIFRFGYSYDYTLSDIRSYSSGSHELSLCVFLYYDDGNDGGKRKGKVKRRGGDFVPTITQY